MMYFKEYALYEQCLKMEQTGFSFFCIQCHMLSHPDKVTVDLNKSHCHQEFLTVDFNKSHCHREFLMCSIHWFSPLLQFDLGLRVDTILYRIFSFMNIENTYWYALSKELFKFFFLCFFFVFTSFSLSASTASILVNTLKSDEMLMYEYFTTK